MDKDDCEEIIDLLKKIEIKFKNLLEEIEIKDGYIKFLQEQEKLSYNVAKKYGATSLELSVSNCCAEEKEEE